MLKRDELIKEAKLLRQLISYQQAEQQRIGSILSLAGIETAEVTFKIPTKTRNLVDDIALSMWVKYAKDEKTYEVQTAKVATVTHSGDPVLNFINSCPSTGILVPLLDMDQTELEDALTSYVGRYVSDAYTEVCTKLITLDLDEQAQASAQNIDV